MVVHENVHDQLEWDEWASGHRIDIHHSDDDDDDDDEFVQCTFEHECVIIW